MKTIFTKNIFLAGGGLFLFFKNLQVFQRHLLYLSLLTVVGLLCIVLLSCVYFCCPYVYCFTVCIVVLHSLVAGLLARSQYPEGPATGHFGTGFSWFPCV
jgi:hypothetical protein